MTLGDNGWKWNVYRIRGLCSPVCATTLLTIDVQLTCLFSHNFQSNLFCPHQALICLAPKDSVYGFLCFLL